MNRPITINYLMSNKAVTVSVLILYNIERIENLQTVTCTVTRNEEAIPIWLHPHKFEIKSVLNQGKYETLFNFENDTKNLDAALFIDLAYATIMAKEDMVIG